MGQPLCRMCGLRHWNFVACDDAIEADEKRRQIVPRFYKTPQNEWGPDKLSNYRQIAPGTFMRTGDG